MSKQVIKRYSKAFKLQAVREYEAGSSQNELRQKYGIGGGSTVQGWVEQYGRAGTRHRLLVIQSLAERVNGILKLEYGLGDCLTDFDHAFCLTREAIWLYNQQRPHLALDYRKPIEVHFS